MEEEVEEEEKLEILTVTRENSGVLGDTDREERGKLLVIIYREAEEKQESKL